MDYSHVSMEAKPPCPRGPGGLPALAPATHSSMVHHHVVIEVSLCVHPEASLHRKKKVREFPVPSRYVTTKLSLGGNNDVITELFLPRGSGCDIPAGDGKLVNLF